MPHSIIRAALAVSVLTLSLGACTMDGFKPSTSSSWGQENRGRPSLVVTSEPPPEVIYRRGSRDTTLADDTASGADMPPVATVAASAPRRAWSSGVETIVTRKVAELARETAEARRAVNGFRDRLTALQARNDALAAEYYSTVAFINTELQSGTTSGNPILTERWNDAQRRLDAMTDASSQLNILASDLAAEASKAAYLQESLRAAYGLSGAVNEDHKRLQELEDEVNEGIVGINRLLTSVNDEINRRAATLRTERMNMQTLSLSVAKGELYGQNVANSLFKKATEDGGLFGKSGAPMAAAPGQRRPLVIIRFDRPNVNFEQPVYAAVSQALEKYPAAKFDLVAVSPSEGNPARIALASTESRKNGEAVLRALTQMGLPMERIRLNAASSRTVANSEVHLYIQ